MSPDGPKSISPEEKLLKLIRGKGSAASGAASPAGGAPPSAASPASHRVPGSARGESERGTAQPRAPLRWGLPAWWLMGVNVLLGALLAIEVLVWILVATKPEPLVELPAPVPSTASVTPASAPTPPETGPDIPPLPSVATRPVFQTPVLAAAPASASSKPSQEAKELAARLTLLGIVDGTPPQAIIEDAQTKKTFFVIVGQSVVDGLVVVDVRENRVTLDFSGETIELSL